MNCLALLAFALGDTVPAEAALPAGFDLSKPWRVVRVADGLEVPAQESGARVYWMQPAGDGAYRIEAAAPKAYPRVEVVDLEGRGVELRHAGRKILRYASAPVPPPDGVDPVFTRSGYVHPIWTPSGKIVTNDYPSNHLHHHGLWWAWTSSMFEGRKSNFWESKEKQGRIECLKIEETWSGPAFGGFRARHRFVNLNAPEGAKQALDEIWELRVWATPEGEGFLFDLVSTQTCATKEPLVIKQYRYGGVGFRGSKDWEGKTGCEFLTSEGRTRADGHTTRARWCAMTGSVDGAPATVGFLNHPSNFRYPQPMRIHDTEPFFNWAVPQAGDFSIEPGTPYVSRYRFQISDGAPAAARLDLQQKAFADASTATLTR